VYVCNALHLAGDVLLIAASIGGIVELLRNRLSQEPTADPEPGADGMQKGDSTCGRSRAQSPPYA
jgi:hypothetical protein